MLKRSLFNYVYLPLFRSARIAHCILNCISDETFYKDGTFDLIRFSEKIKRSFDEVLLAEGANSFRRSDLLGCIKLNQTSKEYLSWKYSIINKKPILEKFKSFWEIKGMHVVCKDDCRQEFSSISRDIHPFCIMSLYFYDKWILGEYTNEFLDKLVKNLDYVGLSSTDNPTYAENHLHIGGAFPTECCILNIINGSKINKAKCITPNADRDIIVFDSIHSLFSIFGNFSRFLFNSELNSENEPVNFPKELKFFELANKFYIESSLSNMRGILPRNFLLKSIVKNFDKSPNSAFFYFLIFLWSKIYSDKPNNIEAIIAYMLVHLVNIIRAYSVMSASNGLEFFTNFFASPIRKIGKNYRYSFDNLFNSGTLKLQYRTGYSDIKENAKEIIKAENSFKEKYANENVRINMAYHCSKKSKVDSKNFMEEKKRIEIYDKCKEILDFAGSCKSICNEHRLYLKIYKDDPTALTQLLEKNPKTNRDVDLMRYLSGIDAAGNEESVPPEVYAPYFRYLSGFEKAQQERTHFLKDYPELIPLRKIFHAGEDFDDIATGLRRIDETVSFLSYQKGDRISHAIALGIDPSEWYKNKSDIRITKINLLDNLVWLTHQAKEIGTPEMLVFIEKHKEHIWELAKELYSNKKFDESELSYENLFEAWKLRRNCPLMWEKIIESNQVKSYAQFYEALIPDIDKKFSNNIHESVPSRLFMYYNRDEKFYKEANKYRKFRAKTSTYEPIEDMFSITSSDIDVIRAVQDFKINEYAQKGIIIEACPSSNIYISDMDSMQNHPIFRWNPPITRWLKERYNKSGIRHNIIDVCVNTDDPAIFPTNLENEFFMLRNAALKLMSEEDDIKEIDEWIERLKNFNTKVFDSNYHQPFIIKNEMRFF